MRKLHAIVSIAGIALITLPACGGDNGNTSGLDKTIEKYGAKSASSGDGCLAGYAEKLTDLLTATEAAGLAGKDAAATETQYNKATKSTAYHECIYKWEGNGRLMKNVAVKVTQDDIISVGCIETMTEAAFKDRYSEKTEEQIAEMNAVVDKQMDKALEGNSTPEANTAAEKLKKAGISKSTAKNTTKSMTGSFGKILKAYRPVDGVGDAAAWNEVSEKLHVLKDGVKVEIGVNLSDDTEVNKAKAIEITRMVLGKCE